MDVEDEVEDAFAADVDDAQVMKENSLSPNTIKAYLSKLSKLKDYLISKCPSLVGEDDQIVVPLEKKVQLRSQYKSMKNMELDHIFSFTYLVLYKQLTVKIMNFKKLENSAM